MRFPKRLRHRGKGPVLATIYRRGDGYRVYWRDGARGDRKTRMRDFSRYGGDRGAKAAADALVKDLSSKGRQPSPLSLGQVNDAVAAFQRLDKYHQSTGREVSLLGAVTEYCESASKLHDHTLGEAVRRFIANEGAVRKVDIRKAVDQFLLEQQARNGQPAPADYNIGIRLSRFAATFLNTMVCDLTKEHVDNFFRDLGKIKSKFNKNRSVGSAKTRNHYRGDVRAFLRWAMRKDYLPANMRLLEASGLKPEKVDTGDIQFYSPDELRALLEAAEGPMRALVAIGGLTGLRTAELLRLDWEDVWHVRGHVEVTAQKAKTRQRRLVEVVPALAEWLRPFRAFTKGRLWELNESKFQKRFSRLCDQAKVDDKPVTRKVNGLRHAFCTYHYAVYSNENLTAQQAGNTPGMLHKNYKGLATKAEGRRWFAVRPPKGAAGANIVQFKAAN